MLSNNNRQGLHGLGQSVELTIFAPNHMEMLAQFQDYTQHWVGPWPTALGKLLLHWCCRLNKFVLINWVGPKESFVIDFFKKKKKQVGLLNRVEKHMNDKVLQEKWVNSQQTQCICDLYFTEKVYKRRHKNMSCQVPLSSFIRSLIFNFKMQYALFL